MTTQYRRANLKKIIKLQKTRCPARFEFPSRFFVIEIQYFIEPEESILDQETADPVIFAINTDGHELLVHMQDDSGIVFQKEFGDIDSLSITLDDLLKAKTIFLDETSAHPSYRAVRRAE